MIYNTTQNLYNNTCINMCIIITHIAHQEQFFKTSNYNFEKSNISRTSLINFHRLHQIALKCFKQVLL